MKNIIFRILSLLLAVPAISLAIFGILDEEPRFISLKTSFVYISIGIFFFVYAVGGIDLLRGFKVRKENDKN